MTVRAVRASRDTAMGPVWIEVTDGAVTRAGWGAVAGPDPVDPLLRAALDEVEAYAAARRTAFTVPLRPAVTGLAAEVSQAMRAIGYGETRTYGEISRDLGAPAQAVGQACGANPIPILIPCHRVLSATGLGGFSAPGGVETKVALLKLERAASLLI